MKITDYRFVTPIVKSQPVNNSNQNQNQQNNQQNDNQSNSSFNQILQEEIENNK